MKKKAFTLIELLIVIAIIAILAAIVFVALDPLSRFQDARNARRWADASALLSAIKVNQIDNGGSYLTTIASTAANQVYMIGTTASGCNTGCAGVGLVTTSTNCLDLTELATDGYLGSVPISPNGEGEWTAGVTGYTLTRGSNGIITIKACEGEHLLSAGSISVAR
jgi:type IV pilus assembly protein PilA